MLAHFGDIKRFNNTVAAVEGSEVVLADGQRLAADVLLRATGYRADLSYFADQRIAGIGHMAELLACCACPFRSVDGPGLYFLEVGLEGAGATPWVLALGARTLMSHIKGTARLDMEPNPHRLNHLDYARRPVERAPAAGAHARQELQAMALAAHTARATCALNAGLLVRRVRRADFLTIETPSHQTFLGPARRPEFPPIALFRNAEPLLC